MSLLYKNKLRILLLLRICFVLEIRFSGLPTNDTSLSLKVAGYTNHILDRIPNYTRRTCLRRWYLVCHTNPANNSVLVLVHALSKILIWKICAFIYRSVASKYGKSKPICYIRRAADVHEEGPSHRISQIYCRTALNTVGSERVSLSIRASASTNRRWTMIGLQADRCRETDK